MLSELDVPDEFPLSMIFYGQYGIIGYPYFSFEKY